MSQNTINWELKLKDFIKEMYLSPPIMVNSDWETPS